MSRLLAVWLLAIVFPVPMLWALWEALASNPQTRLVVCAGALAYCWWLLAILLSMRWRFLDRLVGLKEIYALHGVLGVGALVAAWIHTEYTYTEWDWVRRTGNWALWLATGLVVYSIVFMSGWLVDHSRIAARFKGLVEIVARHQVSLWLHRLNIVVVLLTTAHVHLIKDLGGGFFLPVFDAYTVLTLLAYLYRKMVSPAGWPRGRVSQCRQLNPTLTRVEVALDKPIKDLRVADFFFVTFPTLGQEAHPFSVTYFDDRTISFTIRNLGDGTRKIATLKQGDPVRLEGPFGHFWHEVGQIPEGAPLLLVGMGTGMSALLALARAQSGVRPVRLVWIARHDEDFFERDDLAQLQVDTLLRVGRMYLEDYRQLLTADEVGRGHAFVVGPAKGVLATRALLRRLGYRDDRLHDERMTM